MVVTTILATLATTTLVTLNPTELLAQMRDSQRITTIGMLRDAISLLVADAPTTNLGDITRVHISLPSNDPNCADIIGLPTLPAGQTYRCVTAVNLTRIDGHGWIPLDFRGITDGSPFTHLPVDPINTPTSFYSYIPSPGGRATLTARIESIRQRTLHPTEIFTTHFTSAVDRPPLGTGQVTVPLGSIGAPSYSFVGDLNTGIFSPIADTIAFTTSGVERMRIDHTGFVGIGTTTPGQRLTVEGVIHSRTGGFMFPDGTTQITAGGAGGGPAPGTNAFIGGITVSSLAVPGTPTIAPQGTAGTTTYSYRITARSLVGETLASPAGTTTTGNATLSATNFNRITWASVSGAVDYRIYRTASGGSPATTGLIGTTVSLTFNDTGLAASGAVPTVDNSGHVGIGTTSPTARLEVAGNIIAASPTASNHVATRGWVEALIQPNNLLLSVLSTGVPNVRISGTHPGITNYIHTPSLGTVIALTAPASSQEAAFASWTGCDTVSGTGNQTCNLILNAPRTVTANYAVLDILTVNSSGVTGVIITGAVGAHGGTTNYTRALSTGTVIALTSPTTTGGLAFANWAGCDSVSGAGGVTCNLTLNASRTVTAHFAAAHTLSVQSSGAAGVAITGANTAHSGTTNYGVSVAVGTTVALTAPAISGVHGFINWTGCDSVSGAGNRTCNLTVNAARTVTANYISLVLTVNSTIASNVSITGANTAHSGTTNYTRVIALNTSVSLTAPETAASSIFANWTGCDSVSGAGNRTCNLTVTASRAVTVNYTVAHTLTVNSTPAGVAITGANTAHSGTTNYSRLLLPGTAVALTAPASRLNGNFLSWTGCDSVSGVGNRTCNLTVNASRSATANFQHIVWNQGTNQTCVQRCTALGRTCSSVGTNALASDSTVLITGQFLDEFGNCMNANWHTSGNCFSNMINSPNACGSILHGTNCLCV